MRFDGPFLGSLLLLTFAAASFSCIGLAASAQGRMKELRAAGIVVRSPFVPSDVVLFSAAHPGGAVRDGALTERVRPSSVSASLAHVPGL